MKEFWEANEVVDRCKKEKRFRSGGGGEGNWVSQTFQLGGKADIEGKEWPTPAGVVIVQ